MRLGTIGALLGFGSALAAVVFIAGYLIGSEHGYQLARRKRWP